MKINFVYSRPYDRMMAEMLGNVFSEMDVIKAKKYEYKINKIWKKEENKIINEIEKLSGLKFKRNVDCYIVNNMLYKAISSPLTINMEKNKSTLKSIIIHELIHILFVGNSQKIIKLITKLPEEEHSDKIHYPLLILHRRIIENLYGKKIYKKEHYSKYSKNLQNKVNKDYPKFKKDIIKFLKNVV